MENKTFEWTTGLVKEFVYFKQISWPALSTDQRIEEFIKSKEKCIPDFEIFEYGYAQTVDDLLDLEYISKVKRLSDGEIFAINEKFTANAGCELTIKSFEVYYNTIMVWSKEYGKWNINDIKKAKQKLFTNAYLEIFKGDTFWYTNSNIWTTYKQIADECSVNGLLVKNKYIPFKTKDEADAWYILNKPCLSIQDIKDTFTGKDFIGTDFLITLLEDAVKSKR